MGPIRAAAEVPRALRMKGLTIHTTSAASRAAHLRFDVDDCHQAGGVYLSDGVDLGAVHGVVVRAVLEVVAGRDVGHHLLVRHEHVLTAGLLVASRRPRRVCVRSEHAP